MHLREKFIASLSLLMVVYIAADYQLNGSAMTELFDRLEQDSAQKATVRVKAALGGELALLRGRAIDWAQADGIAEYMDGGRPAFEEIRLGEDVLNREKIDALYLCDPEGNVIWGTYEYPGFGNEDSDGTIASLPDQGGKLARPFCTGWRPEDQIRGLLRAQAGFLDTELGPLMLTTELVESRSGSDGAVGFVMLGRFITSTLTEQIENGVEAQNLSASFFDPDEAPLGLASYVETYGGEPLIEKQNEDWLQVYQLVDAGMGDSGDGTGNPPWLVLRADVDRGISRLAQTASRAALMTTATAALVLMFALMLLLQKIVLAPLKSLMSNAVRVGLDDTADVHFGIDRDDEVGVLSREFDNMMEKLAASRAALVDTAREAGKSEIATGILHNVGNVLNSVNVSTSMLAKKTDELATKDLEALNQIIVDHAEDLSGFMSSDPRGQHFQPFLSALTEQLCSGKDSIADELKSLDTGIDRIRDLVNSQQDYVNRAEVIEICDLSTVIERAIKVSEDVEGHHHDFDVTRDFDDIPRVPIDRYKTLEILVNLIQNARQAIDSHGGDERKLTVRLSAPDEHTVQVEVQDSGIGIAEDSLAKVFDHGFTTKPRGHGFGLHSAANAATEMGGTLTVRSDGVGKGATFIFRLPVRAPQLDRELS
jgi:signal transduction histidine kinase